MKRRSADRPLPAPGRRWLLNVLVLYRVRLRHRWLQELLAVAGIAAGVALLYASLVASTSLSGPVERLNDGLVGNSQLQLVARTPAGVPDSIVRRIQALDGVRIAAPVLQVEVNVIGRRGERPVSAFGADPRTVRLRGPLLEGFTPGEAAEQETVGLPAPIARAIGVRFGDDARMQVAGRSVEVPIAVMGQDDLGDLEDTAIAIVPLEYMQRLAGLPDRITRVLVEADVDAVGTVREGLRALAGDRMDVRSSSYEARLFATAAAPTNQATTISSVVSALIGFLFAFCAILVTVASRRALATDLRLDGYRPSQVIRILLFDALVLGVVAVAIGLVLGDLLSRRGFGADVSFLAGAFPMGDARTVTASSVVIAAAGGLLAAALGVLAPLRRVIFDRVPQRDATAATARRRATRIAQGLGLVAFAFAVVVTVALPGLALAGLIALVLALVLLLPTAIDGVVAGLAWLSGRRGRSIIAVELALPQLRAQEWRARSLAIATTGAIAVFGAVALEGARNNLQAGLDQVSVELNDAADLWVSPSGPGGLLATTPFPGSEAEQLESVPGVASVRGFRSGFLDVSGLRVWVLAPPDGPQVPVPASQIVEGDVQETTARLRSGGWATVSQAVSDELGVGVGDRFRLPASQPIALRVAAITTNLGWSGGAIALAPSDYRRAWRTDEISAYNLRTDPGVDPAHAAVAVRAALGPDSALLVETAAERAERQQVSARSGLSRLSQISSLTLIVAVFAMAAAMAALLWQRRASVARQKLDGHPTGVMWRSLAVESGTLFIGGCLAGAIFALLGQVLFSRGLETISGFPVIAHVQGQVALVSFSLVVAAALLVVAVPGYLVARVRPSLRISD